MRIDSHARTGGVVIVLALAGSGYSIRHHHDITENYRCAAEFTAKQKPVRTTATVVRAAVSERRQDEAVVLVFINQSTTSADKPDPALAASSVRVTLRKVDSAWRISAFDPAEPVTITSEI